MKASKRWAWALPALLIATTAVAQNGKAAMHKQLQQMHEQMSSQQAQARDLKQQIKDLKQHNDAEQASLAQRDRQIAKLKAQLARKQAKAKPAK